MRTHLYRGINPALHAELQGELRSKSIQPFVASAIYTALH